MALTRAQAAQQRLTQINRAYERTHHNFHGDFRRSMKLILRKHGVAPSTPFHDLPAEVHEELSEHKEQLVNNLELAKSARTHSASSLPRIKKIRQ